MTDEQITTVQPADHAFTLQELAAWGQDDVAYVKKVEVKGEEVWAIHAGSGEPLALAPSRDVAIVAIRQNEREPHSVH